MVAELWRLRIPIACEQLRAFLDEKLRGVCEVPVTLAVGNANSFDLSQRQLSTCRHVHFITIRQDGREKKGKTAVEGIRI